MVIGYWFEGMGNGKWGNRFEGMVIDDWCTMNEERRMGNRE